MSLYFVTCSRYFQHVQRRTGPTLPLAQRYHTKKLSHTGDFVDASTPRGLFGLGRCLLNNCIALNPFLDSVDEIIGIRLFLLAFLSCFSIPWKIPQISDVKQIDVAITQCPV